MEEAKASSAAPPSLAQVQAVLNGLELPAGLLDELGIQSPEDLSQIREEDLTGRGLPPIKCRKLLSFISNDSSAMSVSLDDSRWQHVPGADQLPLETVAELKDAFCLFDFNSNGSVDVRELGHILRVLGKEPTQEELLDMMEVVDLNANGTMEFSEFLFMMIQRIDEFDFEWEVLAAFKIFDDNNNGRICENEIRAVLSKLDQTVTDEEISLMLQEAGVDSDGEVDYQAFIEFMLTK